MSKTASKQYMETIAIDGRDNTIHNIQHFIDFCFIYWIFLFISFTYSLLNYTIFCYHSVLLFLISSLLSFMIACNLGSNLRVASYFIF